MYNKKIYITGIPGTGKSTVGLALSKRLKMENFEINDFILDKGLFWGYDIQRDSVIIDNELVIKVIEEKFNERIDGFCLMGPLLKFNIAFDYIIVIRCNPKILRERLETRNYSNEKINENIEAEVIDLLLFDTMEYYDNFRIVEIQNYNKTVEEVVNEVIEQLKE